MSTIVVIPARMASSRFPGKPLVKIAGKPMILHVCERLKNFRTIVATPDKVIYDTVKDAGYEAFQTTSKCKTGTDRLVELSKYIKADIYINAQSDEPLITEKEICAIDREKKRHHNCVIGAVCEMENDTNNVKCILRDGKLLAISRKAYRQRGIYAMNKEELLLFGQAKKDDAESIEITRFMQAGITVRMVIIEDTPDVNVPEDIPKIEARLKWLEK